MRGHAWSSFGAWVLAGGLVFFAVLAAASIGMFLVPVALVALWWLLRKGSRGIEMLGGAAGVGLICLVVAGLEHGADGLDARPWLAAGIALVALAVGVFTAVHGPARPSAPAGRG